MRKIFLFLLLSTWVVVSYAQRICPNEYYNFNADDLFGYYPLDKNLIHEDLLAVNYDTKVLSFRNYRNFSVKILIVDYLKTKIVYEDSFANCCDFIILDLTDMDYGAYKIYFDFGIPKHNFNKLLVNMNYKPTLLTWNDRKVVPHSYDSEAGKAPDF